MQISTLLEKFNDLSLFKGNSNTEINYIQADSRRISPSDIFCAYSSFNEKLDFFCNAAIAKKASSILISKNDLPKIDINYFQNIITSNEDSSVIHGRIASFLKSDPSLKLKIIAVTGTNGKTSSTYILNDIFTALGKKCGIIGTINIKYSDKVIPSSYTTPDPSSLQEILSLMVLENVEYVFLEASSHGLKLGRLNGVNIKAGIFTNLTPDHLDFHVDMNDYLESKFILFELIKFSKLKEKFGVISSDSLGGKEMLDLIQELKPDYKINILGEHGDYNLLNINFTLVNSMFQIKLNGSIFDFKTNLLGRFNCLNLALCVITTINEFPKLNIEVLKNAILKVKPVEGRFEVISNKSINRIGIVDYAHTPDALENILKNLREIPNSKIITVFGCGGDRDRKKRPMMGKIASMYSDHIIITSDNPRTEDPESILDEIQKGIPKEFVNWEIIENRKEAINKGVELLPVNGILLVAGKGHENYQIIGTTKNHFSDKEELMFAFKD